MLIIGNGKRSKSILPEIGSDNQSPPGSMFVAFYCPKTCIALRLNNRR
jgi:hypothetical protein